MKTVLSAILLLPAVAYAQMPTVEQYQKEQKQFWDNALTNINATPTSRIAHNTILYDKVTPFASLFTYNEADNNVSDAVHFRQALSEMYRASDKTLFQSPEILDNNIKSFAGASVVPVGILDVDFTYLNYTPENPHLNALRLENQVFYPINNRPISTQKHITVISPLSKVAMGNTVVYRFDNSWWYQHGNKSIQTLSVDFGNDSSIPVIQNGVLLQNEFRITYSQANEVKKFSFHITYNDGSTLTTYAGIEIMSPNIPTTAKGVSDLLFHTSTIPNSDTGALGKLEYRIFYGDNNTDKKIKKPFIIVDGFDPEDKRKITEEDCLNDTQYKCVEKNKSWGKDNYESIEYLMKYGDNKAKDLKAQLTAQGYDVVIVNFPNYTNNLGQEVDGGADDIFQNGRTVASFIQYINSELQTHGSTEKLVVVGPSMGGQITRYALAYLEKNNIPTNTRLWVSMDSPHQGANIPLAIQGDLYWMGEILGEETAKRQYWNILKSKAARQMLITTINSSNFYNSEHADYLLRLKVNGISGSYGYPVLNGIKKIAITNGSITGQRNVNPSEKFYEIAAFAKVRFFGIKVDNKPVFRINNWFAPEKNVTSSLLQNFSYKPENTTHWKITNNLFYGSLDAVPGGSFNSAEVLKKEIYETLVSTKALNFIAGVLLMTDQRLIVNQRVPNDVTTPIAPQSFIPTHSALDTSGFVDWYQPIQRNLVCSAQTPFDSYYGESSNIPHITFTDNMVTWLINWLNGDEQVSTVPTPMPIQGEAVICENQEEIYFINPCGTPKNTQWTVTGGIIIDQTNSSATVKSNINGIMTLTASFPNSIVAPISKKIWVGKPKIQVPTPNTSDIFSQSLEVQSAVDGVSLEEQGISFLDIKWKRLDTGEIVHGSFFNVVPELTPKNFTVEVKASNICGTDTMTRGVHVPKIPNTCDDEYTLVKSQHNTYAVTMKPKNNNCQYFIPSLDSKTSDTYFIEVVNALGVVVQTSNTDTIEVSSLPTGTYYVRATKNNQIILNQVIIKN